MITKHIYKLFVIILAFILYQVSKDFYYHLKAYDEQKQVLVTIIGTDCRIKGSSNIDIQHKNSISFVEVLEGKCTHLKVGQKINVLYSAANNKYYWNKEPSTRPFYLFPFILALIAYLIYIDLK